MVYEARLQGDAVETSALRLLGALHRTVFLNVCVYCLITTFGQLWVSSRFRRSSIDSRRLRAVS